MLTVEMFSKQTEYQNTWKIAFGQTQPFLMFVEHGSNQPESSPVFFYNRQPTGPCPNLCRRGRDLVSLHRAAIAPVPSGPVFQPSLDLIAS